MTNFRYKEAPWSLPTHSRLLVSTVCQPESNFSLFPEWIRGLRIRIRERMLTIPVTELWNQVRTWFQWSRTEGPIVQHRVIAGWTLLCLGNVFLMALVRLLLVTAVATNLRPTQQQQWRGPGLHLLSFSMFLSYAGAFPAIIISLQISVSGVLLLLSSLYQHPYWL